MTRRTTKKAAETVEIDGVKVPKSELEKIPVGATFTVAPANLIWSNERIYKKTSKDKSFTVIDWVDKPTEEDKEGKLKFGEPVDSVQVGMRKILLPDAVTQKKGFYHPEANLLRRVVGGLKEFKAKGEK